MLKILWVSMIIMSNNIMLVTKDESINSNNFCNLKDKIKVFKVNKNANNIVRYMNNQFQRLWNNSNIKLKNTILSKSEFNNCIDNNQIYSLKNVDMVNNITKIYSSKINDLILIFIEENVITARVLQEIKFKKSEQINVSALSLQGIIYFILFMSIVYAIYNLCEEITIQGNYLDNPFVVGKEQL